MIYGNRINKKFSESTSIDIGTDKNDKNIFTDVDETEADDFDSDDIKNTDSEDYYTEECDHDEKHKHHGHGHDEEHEHRHHEHDEEHEDDEDDDTVSESSAITPDDFDKDDLDPDDGDFNYADSLADEPDNVHESAKVLQEKGVLKKLLGILDFPSKEERKNPDYKDFVKSIADNLYDKVVKSPNYQKSFFKKFFNVPYKAGASFQKISKKINKGKIPKFFYIVRSTNFSPMEVLGNYLFDCLDADGFTKSTIGDTGSVFYVTNSIRYKIYKNIIVIFSFEKQKQTAVYSVGNTTTYSTYWEYYILFRCVANTDHNRNIFNIKYSGQNVAESAPAIAGTISSDDEDDKCDNGVECGGKSPEELYGFAARLTVSDETRDNDYAEFSRNPEIMRVFTEYFNIANRQTRRNLLSLNEAEQGALIKSITSKIYDKIVSKVDDIDYGEIPKTNGDITKLSKYSDLVECLNLIRSLVVEMKQDATPIDTVSEAISNIILLKETFERAFKNDTELPIIMYNNLVLAVVASISLMISTSVEFVKSPNSNSFDIILNKMAYNKSKNYMLFGTLKKFNKSCKKGDFAKAMDYAIKERVNHSTNEAAALGAVGGFFATHGVAIAVGTVLSILAVFLIPGVLKELVFIFYHMRVRVSDFFNIQADLLEMNAYKLKNSETNDQTTKEKIANKQMKLVANLRKIANFFAIKFKKAEVDTNNEMTADNKKMDLTDSDVSDIKNNVDSASSSALF